MTRLETYHRARRTYYNALKRGEKPLVMSDGQFDAFEMELLDSGELSERPVGIASPKSPWVEVRHTSPMGSQDKIHYLEGQLGHQFDEARAFLERTPSKSGYGVLHKFDGISVNLFFENGFLVQAVTRGERGVGKDITRNVQRMQGFRCDHMPGIHAEIRAEIILPVAVFEEHFPNGTNPRNVASGAAKALDGANCHHLSVIGYTLQNYSEGTEGHNKGDDLHIIDMFVEPAGCFFVESLDGIEGIYEGLLGGGRARLPYEIDGIIIEVYDRAEFESYGIVSECPRGSVAFKFPNQAASTTVAGVTWASGRTGQISPVLQVEPVHVAGVEVTNITLHNAKRFMDWKLSVGDTVIIERCGDVIPGMVQNVTKNILVEDIT